ncbi:MAG: cytochrome b/b6 domain-containing protein [Terriglobia bacterium]
MTRKRSETDWLIRDDEVFIRMNLAERLQHGFLILCFVLLVLTGLPLLTRPVSYTQGLFLFEWGFRLRGILHRGAGVGLILVSLFHLYYITATRRGREIFVALLPRMKDVSDALQTFGHNLGFSQSLYRKGIFKHFFDRHPYWLFTEPPLYGRYNFIEKFEYLALVWGNLVMITTGAFLWATNLSLRWFPLWIYDIFKIIHGYEAVLAFLAIIIWHLYNVHLSRGVFPMSKVFLNGKITGKELREHHFLEYKSILEERRRRMKFE